MQYRREAGMVLHLGPKVFIDAFFLVNENLNIVFGGMGWPPPPPQENHAKQRPWFQLLGGDIPDGDWDKLLPPHEGPSIGKLFDFIIASRRVPMLGK